MGQNEDYNLGDSIQVALQNCSREVEVKVSILYDFSERDYMQSSTHFCRSLLLTTRGRFHH